MALEIIISNSGGQPIYEQICAQIKAAILGGQAAEGELLPSIRSLAKDLRISVITTKRAYEELEKEGFIYSQAGKGFYVGAPDKELLRESQLREIEGHIEQIRELAALCKLSREELLDMMEVIFQEE